MPSNSCIVKMFLVFSLALLVNGNAKAQSLSDYNFIPSSGTFTPLTGATIPTLSGGSLDDGYYNNLPIGFTFNYLGMDYTTISATTNGCAVLGQTLSSTMLTNDLTNGTPRPILAPLWDDLDQETFGTFSYKTEGTAPNRVFTAEWLNFAWNFSATVPVISFQLKLYETTNRIEFIYRQEAGAVVSGSASIGITAVGTGPGNFLSLDGTGPNPNVSSTIETSTLSTKPATGQIYAFIPLPYPRISHTPLTNTPSTGPRLVVAEITSSVGLAGPPNQPRLYYRTSPGDYTAVPMTNTNGDTWQATIPGQPIGTMVEYYLAAQDTSVPPLVKTAPAGGSGVNPPGTTPPPVPYSYRVLQLIAGTKYIVSGITGPDTYPSFTSAINDLNASVVGTGGVIFNVPANQIFTEILPPITATGTAANPIIFQKTGGSDANPVVQRTDAGTIATSVLGGQGDAVITIDGGDFITFDGIDINTTDQGIEYGYYLRKLNANDGCKNVTIKNANITMTKGTSGYVVGIYASNNDATSSPSSATGITVTSDGGRTENLLLIGNNIRNVFTGIILRGNSSYPDLYPVVGNVGQGNVITNYAGNTSATAYGIYMIYQIMPTVSYNYINNTANGGSNFTSTGYGIMNSTTTNGGGTITYNEIDLTTNSGQLSGIYSTTGGTNPLIHANNQIKLSATGGSGTVYFNYITGTYSSITVSDNIFMTNGIASTGTCYLIYNSNATQNTMIANNVTSGLFNRTASSGTFYGYYNYGVPAGGTEYLMNNNFSNITLAGSSTFYGIYSNTATAHNRVTAGNVISNIVGGTGTTYGLSLVSTTSNQVYNNTVDSIIAGGTVYGLNVTGTNPSVYNNLVRKIRTTGTTIYGIYLGGSGTTNCYNNRIYNLTSTTTSSPIVDGIYISTGLSVNIYNNFISNLNAPTGSSATAIAGIYNNVSTSSAVVNIYYNSIYLNATSTGANFGTIGVYASTTPTVDIRNNVIVNTSTPNGTGLTVAYRRSSTTLTTYANTSNNNCFYAGIPSASRLIFYDGTNADQTLAAFKARVFPRDNLSVTEAVNFVSANDLHINNTIPTRLESGARPIAGITTDIDGDARVYPSEINTNVFPDIGADEFSGIPIDEFGPIITYTPLPHTSALTNRTLTATIVDVISGVSVAPGQKPTLWYNKNRGSWYQDSLSTPPWIFTIDVAALGGVIVGDTVFYYVSAYDSSGNMAVNPVTAPTLPNYYVITQAPLSGNYTVGLAMFNSLTGRNVYFEPQIRKVLREAQIPIENSLNTTKDKNSAINNDDIELTMRTELIEVEEISWLPMENGKPYLGDLYIKKSEHPEIAFPEGIEGVYATITAAVADLNLRGVNGPTNFLLVDNNYPNETYPITIDVRNEYLPTATNRVTIKPNTGVIATISGASASSQIFRIISSYITIDGSNSGGTDRSLTIQNTSTTSPQVIAIAPGTTTPTVGVTVKNCNIINGANTSSAVVIGNPGYFNDIVIQNNSVELAYIGVYVKAEPVVAGNGSGTQLIGNDLNSSTNPIRLVGLYMQGVDGGSISNNNIGNFATVDASNITGVWIAAGSSNSVVTNNTIGPINSSSGAPRGIAISTSLTNSNILVANNNITDIASSYSSAPYGIYVFSTTGNVIVEKNKVARIYNTNTGGYGARGIHIYTGIANSNITVKNNFVWDVRATADVGTTFWGIGIGIEGATGDVKVYYNSVNLYGTMTGYSAATVHTAFGVITSTATNLDVRNNIFVNSFDNTNSTTDKSYAINSQAPASAFVNIDFNDYYVSGTAGVLGYLGTDRLTLSAWQSATGQDANSISANPMFTEEFDLHILPTVISPVNRAATPIVDVYDDIDNEVRNPMYPDIGADEYTPNPPQAFSLISPTNGAVTQPLTGLLVWHQSARAEFYEVYLDDVYPPITKVSTQFDTVYQYNLMPNKIYYWQVIAYNDTVIPVEGSTASPIWSFQTEIWDVGAVQIISPRPIGFAGNLIIPKVKVRNFGDVPQTFTVTMHIGSIYTDIKTVNDLAANDSLIVDFAPWIAVLGTYDLLAYTTLEFDNNPENDTVRGVTEIQEPAHNVGPLEIIAPIDTIDEGTIVYPTVRIKNFGAYIETNFSVRFKIGDIYNQIVYVPSLAPDAETTLIFPAWTAVRCNYVVSCSTELENDQLPEDDMISELITVRFIDVGITAIITPQDTIVACNEYQPTIVVTNNSVHSFPATCTLLVKILRYPAIMNSYCDIGISDTPEIISEDQQIIELAMGEEVTVNFSTWHPYWWDIYWISEPTYHEIIVQIRTPNDMNNQNDYLEKRFIVKGPDSDLQMNWTGLLDHYTPIHQDTIPNITYNLASVVSYSAVSSNIRFRVWVNIIRERDEAIVYTRYLNLTMMPNTYYCLPFSTGWTATEPGSYLVRSWVETRPGLDAIAENSCWERRYYITASTVAKTNSIGNPALQGNQTKIPNSFNLQANRPNPFSNYTKIQWQIPIDAQVMLSIYDASGRVVKTLVNEKRPAGYYSTIWDGTDENNHKVSAGIYFYEMKANNYRARQKMIVTQ
ncbi:MAG: FlgD immunoglobulin-like domain containing protein [candidate division WOR-3 bacterium]